jgi:hypothetical protein
LLAGSQEEPVRIIPGNSPAGHSYWQGDLSDLAIEHSQVYLPTRHSQLMDVIDNFAGTILGLILFHLAFDHEKMPADFSRHSGH